MASKGRSLAERIATWNSLRTNLRQDVTDLPQVASDLDGMDQLAAEAQALFGQIQVLRGQVRVATLRLRKVGRDGDMLRSRIGATLRGALGFEAGQLLKYGFRPRTRRIIEVTEPGAAPAPAATEISVPVEISAPAAEPVAEASEGAA
ncbi:MAG TPA: hypothetical protein VOA87_09850 [Thermoanaerobaculia bacterium]|nr:hypothetical protein [Thermoanaerobaculia bacterium]